MRGRMCGVLSVCIGSGPIGFLALGVLADIIGASPGAALSGGVGLGALAAEWARAGRAGGDVAVVAPARQCLSRHQVGAICREINQSRNRARAAMLAT